MDELTRKRLFSTIAVQNMSVGKRLPPAKKPEENNQAKENDCRMCVHFFVTWQKNSPYGCKAYGFKGPQMPSVVVKASSGEPCKFFKQRS